MKKIILKPLCLSLLIILLCSLVVFTACGEEKILGIQVKEGSLKTQVFLNDEIDFSGLVLEVDYEDGTTGVIELSDDIEVGEFDTSTLGRKTVLIKYKGQEFEFNYTVIEKAVTLFSVKAGTLPTQVERNATLDTANLILNVTLEDGSTEEVAFSNDIQISTYTTTDLGQKTVTLTYKNKICRYTFEVVKAKSEIVKSIAVKAGTELKTEVERNESLNIDDLKLVVTYEDNHSADIDYNGSAQISAYSTADLGQKTITITYEGKTCQYTFEVVEAAENIVRSFDVKSGSIATEVKHNEQLDLSKGVLVVIYEDDSQKNINVNGNSDVVFGAIDTTTLGNKSVTITYKGKTATFNYVVVKKVTSFVVKSGTINTKIKVNESLNVNDGILIVTYSDNTEDEVAINGNTEMTIGTIDNATIGNKTVNITFEGVVVAYAYTVIDVESFVVKTGTINTTIKQFDELDKTTGILVVTYSDSSIEEVLINGNSDVTFGTVDTTTTGDKSVTIYYEGKSYTFYYSVVPEIVGVDTPALATQFLQNRAGVADDPSTTDVDESENSFKVIDNTYTYKVGADNPFIFMPQVMALDTNDNPVSITACELNIKVELKENSTYTTLTGNDLASYVAIDNMTGAFDFTSDAVGKIFKLSVLPTDYEDASATSVLEVEIVNGYNVQSEAQLSVLNNISSANFTGSDNESQIARQVAEGWESYKEAHNVVTPNNFKGVVLHKNLTITDDCIPSALYKMVNDRKSMYDWISIYCLNNPEGNTFTFYGNYFKINASAITKVYDIKDIAAHTALFGFDADNWNTVNVKQGDVIMENLFVRGNSQKAEGEENLGGYIMIHTNQNNTTIKNCVLIGSQTQVVALHNRDSLGGYDNRVEVIDTKMYDTYSTMLYMYGVKNCFVKDSILKRAGGPLIMATHVNPKNNPTSRYCDVVMQNTVAESWVSGAEAWFTVYQATQVVSNLKALNQLFAGTGLQLKNNEIITDYKNFVDNSANQLMNFIGIVMANDPMQTEAQVMGSITIKGGEGNVISVINPSNTTLRASIQGLVSVNPALVALPFFQSSALSIGEGSDPDYFVTVNVDGLGNPTGFGRVTTGLNAWPADMSDYAQAVKFFSGDYINVYANGGCLGVVAQYMAPDYVA